MGPAWDCAMRVVPRLGQQVALWLHAPSLQPEPQTHPRSRALRPCKAPAGLPPLLPGPGVTEDGSGTQQAPTQDPE